jgi:hypothetical protein
MTSPPLDSSRPYSGSGSGYWLGEYSAVVRRQGPPGGRLRQPVDDFSAARCRFICSLLSSASAASFAAKQIVTHGSRSYSSYMANCDRETAAGAATAAVVPNEALVARQTMFFKEHAG